MTGRGAGYCTGNAVPGYMNPVGGRGMGFGSGFGRGFGRGWGRGYGRGFGAAAYGGFGAGYGVPAYGAYGAYGANPVAPWTREQELEALKAQAEGTRAALEDIQKRIDDLESSKE